MGFKIDNKVLHGCIKSILLLEVLLLCKPLSMVAGVSKILPSLSNGLSQSFNHSLLSLFSRGNLWPI